MKVLKEKTRENKIAVLNKISIKVIGLLLIFVVLDQRFKLSSTNHALIQIIYGFGTITCVGLLFSLLYQKSMLRKIKIY